jgi:hypothetical protein
MNRPDTALSDEDAGVRDTAAIPLRAGYRARAFVVADIRRDLCPRAGVGPPFRVGASR